MIAELLEVSKPMITAHITALENKAYIKKDYSNEDKRSFFVVPTKKAEKLVEQAAQKMKNQIQHIENELGKDNYEKLLIFLKDTNKILSNMKGDNR